MGHLIGHTAGMTFRSVDTRVGIRTRSDQSGTRTRSCPLFMSVRRTGRSFVRVALGVAPGRHDAWHRDALGFVTIWGLCECRDRALPCPALPQTLPRTR